MKTRYVKSYAKQNFFLLDRPIYALQFTNKTSELKLPRLMNEYLDRDRLGTALRTNEDASEGMARPLRSNEGDIVK